MFRCLKKLIGRFGVPISDQGREFYYELNDRFCSISPRISTAYHPQCNGFTERFNQTICACLSKFSDGGKLNWEDDLDGILLGYRSSMQSSSLYSPFEHVYGVKARLPIRNSGSLASLKAPPPPPPACIPVSAPGFPIFRKNYTDTYPFVNKYLARVLS